MRLPFHTFNNDFNFIYVQLDRQINHPNGFDFKDHAKKYQRPYTDHYLVRYTPKFQKTLDLDYYCCDNKLEQIYDRYNSFNFFNDLCFENRNQSLRFNSSILTRKKKNIDIDLLITFNHKPRIFSIELVYHYYRNNFRNIIFCGENISLLLNENRSVFKKFDSYTFIDNKDSNRGHFVYFCMNKAIEINNNAKGILFMSDDILIKTWYLEKFDTKKVWSPETLEAGRSPGMFGWNWWNSYMGKPAMLEVFKLINEILDNKAIISNPGLSNYQGKSIFI